jgi:hypothetical protein
MPFDAQIYRLASIARDKLCREASRASHDLRCLVAHANLLDELLIELSTPRGGPADHYGFDLLPQPVTKATTPRPSRPIVVTVMESSQHELEDEGHLASSEHIGSHSTPSTLPMLYHDPESESDSGSDSDGSSDDSDDFETAITSNSPPTSPTTSISTTVEDDVEPNEDDLALHRTKSGWRLLGNYPSKERSRRKEVTPASTITNGFQRVNLSAA